MSKDAGAAHAEAHGDHGKGGGSPGEKILGVVKTVAQVLLGLFVLFILLRMGIPMLFGLALKLMLYVLAFAVAGYLVKTLLDKLKPAKKDDAATHH